MCPLVEGSAEARGEGRDRGVRAARSDEDLAGLRLGLLHGQMPAPREGSGDGRVPRRRARRARRHDRDRGRRRRAERDGDGRRGRRSLRAARSCTSCAVASDAARDASWCFLLADPTTAEAKARMEAMAASTDGFQLAERDLEIRGAGEVFGERQSGFTDLKLGRLPRDEPIVVEARAVGRAHPRRRSRPRRAPAAARGGRGPARRRRRVPVQELTESIGDGATRRGATGRLRVVAGAAGGLPLESLPGRGHPADHRPGARSRCSRRSAATGRRRVGARPLRGERRAGDRGAVARRGPRRAGRPRPRRGRPRAAATSPPPASSTPAASCRAARSRRSSRGRPRPRRRSTLVFLRPAVRARPRQTRRRPRRARRRPAGWRRARPSVVERACGRRPVRRRRAWRRRVGTGLRRYARDRLDRVDRPERPDRARSTAWRPPCARDRSTR